MTRSRWGVVGLALVFFAYTALTAQVGFSPYDDAVFTYGGWAIAHGGVPYDDFWTLYNPGQFLLIGAFFRFVTESVLALRFVESAVVAGCGILVWDLCRRLYSPTVAVEVSCVFTIWLGAGSALYPYHENHVLTSMLLTLAGFDLLLIGVPEGRTRALVGAGACAGACFVIRQDAALYVLLPLLFGFVLWRATVGRPWGEIGRRAAAYGAGAAAVIVPVFAWVLAVAPGAWWQQAVVFPIARNPALRATPFEFRSLDFSGTGAGATGFLHILTTSARDGFFYLLPFIVALSACAVVITYLLRRAELTPIRNRWGFAVAAVLLVASLDYARVRSDFQHIFPSILLSFLVIPGVAAVIQSVVRRRVARSAIGAVAAFVLVFAIAIPISARLRVTEGFRDGVRLSSGLLEGIVIDNRDNGPTIDWAHVQAAADYVRARTDPTDPIFVAEERNDHVFASYPVFYVLAGRMAGTRHAELYPGVTTRDSTQRAIIEELEAAGVRYVVRWPVGDNNSCPEPNLACHPETPGSTTLDEYLNAEYEPVARFDVLEVLRRRP